MNARSCIVWPDLHVSVFKRYVWVLLPPGLHDYPVWGGLTKYRQTRGETWHGLWKFRRNRANLLSGAPLPVVLHSDRPFLCVKERQFWREQRGTSAVMLGWGPDKACYTRPSPTTTLSLSLSPPLSVSVYVSLSFSLLVSYHKTINRHSRAEFCR